MFCQKCGAEIPENSTFCRQCGAPIKGAVAPGGTPAIFSNLLNSLKLFFTKGPEDGIMSAAASKTHEWSILLGTNVTMFMFAFAIIGACLQFSFGFHLLFGFIIALIANGVMFGAFFGVMTLLRKKLPFVGMLNLYAYTTIPLTIAAVLSMPFAPVWHLLPMLFFAIAVLAQILLMFLSLQKANDGRVNFHLFMGLMAGAIAILFVASHWLNVAAVKSAIDNDLEAYNGITLMTEKYGTMEDMLENSIEQSIRDYDITW